MGVMYYSPIRTRILTQINDSGTEEDSTPDTAGSAGTEVIIATEEKSIVYAQVEGNVYSLLAIGRQQSHIAKHRGEATDDPPDSASLRMFADQPNFQSQAEPVIDESIQPDGPIVSI